MRLVAGRDRKYFQNPDNFFRFLRTSFLLQLLMGKPSKN